MRGRTADGGRADAAAYTEFVHDVITCLYSLSVIVAGKKITYLIKGVRSNSANCILISRDDPQSQQIARGTYSLFEETVSAFEHNGRCDDRIGLYEMKQLARLVKPFKAGASSIKVGQSRITSKFGENVKNTMGGAARSVGVCKGVIRAMQTYGKNMFRLFPAIEGNSIVCHFDDTLKARVLEYYEKNVMVYGVKSTLPGRLYPSMIEVTEIQPIPSDSDLPRLRDLHGIVPGGLHMPSIEAFRMEFNEAFGNG